MPEMDGLELCRRIRASDRPSYSYVILLTALHGKSSYLQGMNAGADDFVSKPFDPDELNTRLIVAERIIGVQNRVKHLERYSADLQTTGKKIRDEQNQWVGIEAQTSATVAERRSVTASVRSATRTSSSQNWIASCLIHCTMDVSHPSAPRHRDSAKPGGASA